jgi:hypothetical protein
MLPIEIKQRILKLAVLSEVRGHLRHIFTTVMHQLRLATLLLHWLLDAHYLRGYSKKISRLATAEWTANTWTLLPKFPDERAGPLKRLVDTEDTMRQWSHWTDEYGDFPVYPGVERPWYGCVNR